MSQTREKWPVLSRGDFWIIWRCHSILCFHFYFLFRNNGIREQLDQNDFRRCYGNFFPKVPFWKYLITTMFKVISQQLQDALATAFARHLPVEDFTDIVSSLPQDIWVIVVCFSFSQTNLAFKPNLMLIG